jgi:hypothetical protein
MPTTIIKHEGKKGDTGTAGIDGAGTGAIRESLIASPCLDVFKSNKLSEAVTWAREDDAVLIDRYGQSQIVAGDSFEQIVRRTDSYNVAVGYWEYPDLDTTIINDQNQPDPLGGSGATTLEFNGTDNSTFGMNGSFTGVVDSGEVYRFSFYAKLVSGTIDGVELKFGGSNAPIQTFSKQLTASWQRFDIVTQPTATGSTFRLFFRTSGTAQIDLFRVNATTGSILRSPVLYDGLATQIVTNPNPVYRENEKGYLIEGLKENLCPYSQALTEWDLGNGAIVSQYSEVDPFGNVDLPILVSFGDNASITVSRSDLDITTGTGYAVSFYAKIESGGIETFSATLGGSEAQVFELTGEFVRYTFLANAGSQPSITFNAVTDNSASSFVLTGIQVELDSPSSYIQTAELKADRKADLVSMSGSNLPSLINPFTFLVSVNDLPFVAGDKSYILKVGDFELYTENDTLVFKIGGVSVNVAAENDCEAVFVYNGSQLLYYLNGGLVSTTSAVFSATEPATAYIGASDAAGLNALNGSIKFIKAWDFAMTDSEVKYVSGAYQLNRFIDRG